MANLKNENYFQVNVLSKPAKTKNFIEHIPNRWTKIKLFDGTKIFVYVQGSSISITQKKGLLGIFNKGMGSVSVYQILGVMAKMAEQSLIQFNDQSIQKKLIESGMTENDIKEQIELQKTFANHNFTSLPDGVIHTFLSVHLAKCKNIDELLRMIEIVKNSN